MNYASEIVDRDRTGLVGVLTLLVAVGLPIAAILTAGSRDVEVQPGLIDWVFVAGVAVVTLITFGALTRWRARKPNARTDGAGLTFATIALLATPVTFWTMVPVVFGSAGAWLGYRAIGQNQAEGRSSRRAIAAVALGGLAALASVAMYLATS